MDPRFNWVSGSSSEILPFTRNPLYNFQNPNIDGSSTSAVNNFGEDDFITSTSNLSGFEDYSRFGEVLGSFTGMNNNILSNFQNPNLHGSTLVVDYNLMINQRIDEDKDRSVKHKFGVAHFLSGDPSTHYSSIPPPPPSLDNAVYDPRFNQIMGPLNDTKFRMIPLSTCQTPSINSLTYENIGVDTNVKHNLCSETLGLNAPSTSDVVVAVEDDDHNEEIDFSDAILGYINQILMEEDMEDKVYMLQESLELQAKEQSLYEALGKTSPPFTEPKPPSYDQYIEIANESLAVDLYSPGGINGSDVSRPTACNASGSSTSIIPNGLLGPTIAPLPTLDESNFLWNFRKGVEEANKFLPAGNKLTKMDTFEVFKMEKKVGGDSSSTLSRRRKKPYNGDVVVDLEEERSIKQAAIYTEPILRSEQFDIVLLHSMGEGAAALAGYRENLQAEKNRVLQQNQHRNGSKVKKGNCKKQNQKKKEVVDLRTLLIRCAQAAAADDHRAASELLKEIRKHSTPFGDGNQRLAHCFADGLEARIAGNGSEIFKALVKKRTLAVDYLKAYHLYLASCPFRKISIFGSNRTILDRAEGVMRVHVIDFGILYGFQWPSFIQHLAVRKGGPPKLKITGIEFPQAGFRPAEQVEETGHRLAEYAKMFDVPFEYNAIAKRWDTIKPEDIKTEDGELVVVNCLYRFKNILDETASLESSRTNVLNIVKKINPDIFIHGVVNGAYNAPFFVTRFREALFHFSSLFDMLEANVPREIPERMLIEKEIFGREALNVIACEGWERVERPETYKQWQVRNLKAGFTQIPFDRKFMAMAIKKVSGYHKDFVIDEDGQWLLLGWKGRTIYAMSCWQPL